MMAETDKEELVGQQEDTTMDTATSDEGSDAADAKKEAETIIEQQKEDKPPDTCNNTEKQLESPETTIDEETKVLGC
jgi:hypothetical protein